MSMNVLIVRIISALIVLAGVLIVLQIWGVDILSWTLFIKLIGTLGVVVLVLGFLLAVKFDFSEHKKMKDENYLD